MDSEASWLPILHELSLTLGQTLDLDRECQTFLDWLRRHFAPRLTLILLTDESGERLTPAACIGWQGRLETSLAVGLDPWTWLEEQGVPLPKGERYTLPVFLEGRLWGMVCLISAAKGVALQQEQRLLNLAVAYLAPVLRNIQRVQHLDRLVAERTAQLELAAAEWRQTFDSMSDAVTIHDRNFRIRRANRAAAELFGLSIKELLGRRCYHVPHDQECPIEQCPFKRVVRNLTVEREVIWEPTLEKYLHVTTTPMLDEQGEAIGAVHVVRDVTHEMQTRQALERQLRELQVLHKAALIGVQARDEAALLSQITDLIGETFYPDHCGVLLLDKLTGVLRPAPSYRGISSKARKTAVPLGQGITGWVAQHGKSRRVGNVRQTPEYIPSTPNIRSELAVPIQIEEHVLGVLNVESRQEDAFTKADERLLSTIATQLALSLTNIRLYRQALHSAERRETLYHTSQQITRSVENPEQICFTIYQAVARLMPVEAFFIARWDRTAHEIEFLYLMDKGGCYEPFRVPEGHGISSEVLRHGEPLLINDFHPEKVPQAIHFGDEEHVRSVLAVPMRKGERIVGVISAQSYTPYAYTQEDVHLLEMLASSAAIALENTRLLEETRQHVAELEAVAHVSQALRAAETVDEMLPLLLEQACKVTNSAIATVFLRDEDGYLTLRAAYPPNPALIGLQHAPGEGITGHVVESGEPYLHTDLKQNPVVHMLPGEAEYWADIHALISLPLKAPSGVIGVIHIGRRSEAPFSESDLRVLRSLAEIAANAIQRASLHELTLQQVEELEALRAVDLAIIGSADRNFMLQIFFQQAQKVLSADALVVWRYDPYLQTLVYQAGSGTLPREVQHARLNVNQPIARNAVLAREPIVIPDLPAYLRKNPEVAPIDTLTRLGYVSYVATPLKARSELEGVLEVFFRHEFHPSRSWLSLLDAFATQAAIALDHFDLLERLHQANRDLRLAYDATLRGWARTLELRDRETEGHSQRVVDFTMRLAKALGVPHNKMEHIYRGALLHDIGKMGIPDAILRKPGPLTEDEWTIMKQHPIWAYELLKEIPFLQPALDIPYCHHERWDGSGYPRGLKGEEIPLAARIFAVVDVWDALISDRPYRPAWSREKALAYLRENAGVLFDPRVVEAFIQMLEEDA